jgi:hypothetical protein
MPGTSSEAITGTIRRKAVAPPLNNRHLKLILKDIYFPQQLLPQLYSVALSTSIFFYKVPVTYLNSDTPGKILLDNVIVN